MAFDDNGQPVYGRLNTDRPHQLKLSGFYQLPTRTGLGARFYAGERHPDQPRHQHAESARRCSTTAG